MMSKPSRLAKPSKSSGRKEPPGSRSRMLSVGERLMRAGSEGNLVRPRTSLQQQQTGSQEEPLRTISPLAKELSHGSNQRLAAAENEALGQHLSSSADDSDHSDPWSPRTLPRRYTVGGPRSAGDVLAMQPHNVDRKREAFLEHLKQKYPHHASTIMGHQERVRDQVRLPKHSPSPQPGIGDQGEPLSVASLESLEAMSEGDSPSAFTRGTRSRASLPVVRSTNQTKDRSLGVLYLQYGEETKQIRMPNEITGGDTIRALFVSAFPQQLNMKMLDSPSVAVYIKDDMRNIYYELTDVRNITPHSCLKVYHKDPAQAFNHNSKPNNGDVRIHREKLYGSRDGQNTLRQAPGSPISNLHALQGSMSPPTARSMPSSPSRIPYGPSRSSVPMPGSVTLPRERLSSAPQPTSRSATPCSSAILERRDVKPDEDLGGSKSVALFDPYGLPEGRLSVSSTQGSHGPGDVVDGALQQQQQQQQHSLYRQKSRKYSENPMATLGGKTQPPSPHRVNEVRMIDVPPQGVPVERGSPVRRSFRKNSNGPMEGVAGGVHGAVGSPVFVDLPPGHGTRPFQSGVPSPGDPHTSERMKAMEKQIASLTGLVQHALLKGPSTSAAKDPTSERPVRTASPANSVNSGGASPAPVPKSCTPPQPDSMAVVLHSSAKDTEMQSMLTYVRRNVSDLRLQLHQLRQIQLQNQDSMKAMLRRAEQEITGRFTDMLRHLEDPVQRQRSQVDQERHMYLAMEENVLIQLGELEKNVERLKRDSTSGTTSRPITLKDVEEGAVNLRKVGEALAGLKGEYPALQTKMRAVLRVEVEAVRFLKEEPHKMDSMLKRVKALTETLSCLRRFATEGVVPSPEPVRARTAEAAPAGSDSSGSSRGSPTPQPRSPGAAIRSELTPSSPMVVHRVRSSPVAAPVCQHSASLSHHAASPPLTPTHARDAPTVAKVSPRSRENSPAQQKRDSLLRATVEEALGNPGSSTATATTTSAANSCGSATPPPVSTEEPPSSRGSPRHRSANAEPSAPERHGEEEEEEEEEEEGEEEEAQPDVAGMERLLHQTQASLMQAIPSLEVPGQGEMPLEAPPDEVDAPLPAASAPELPPKPAAEKPVAPGSVERAQKPAMEKPHRPSVDRAKANSAEKASKSPPPPPPRRFFPSGSGLTTGRSGEVIYTSHNRKESASTEEGEEEPPLQPKALKVPPEVKPKPQSPPPVVAAALAPPVVEDEHDEDDEGDKIMAELQVFERCTVKELEAKCFVDLSHVEPERPEPESPAPNTPRDSKQTTALPGEETNQTKDGKDASPQGSRVVYYVTGQISNERPAAADTGEQKEGRGRTLSQPKVAHANAFDFSQKPKLLTSDEFPTVSHKPAGQSQSMQPSTRHTDVTGPRPACPDMEKCPNKEQGTPEPVLSLDAQEREAPPAKEGAVTEQLVNGIQSEHATTSLDKESPVNEEVVMRSCKGRVRYTEDAGLSPDLPDEGPPPPSTDSIAFMITQTKVQALSSGEYRELVSQGGEVQTVTVGMDQTCYAPEDCGFDRKPVIIIFDEPMEIRQAYKRLSTIFENEEELERMLTEERIEEENEEAEEEEEEEEERASREAKGREVTGLDVSRTDGAEVKPNNQRPATAICKPLSPREPSSPDLDHGFKTEPSPNDPKQDAKKKFKFKFPKKQLAAIGLALRTGTKTGKKTLQVVVYEDEEEPNGTVKELKETKRFEIQRKSRTNQTSSSLPSPSTPKVALPTQSRRTEEIRKNTFKTLDSLEETIKELESTISDLGPNGTSGPPPPEQPSSPRGGSKVKRSVSESSQSGGSPSKRAPPPESKAPKVSSLRKRVKPHLPPRPSSVTSPPTSPTTTPGPTSSSVSSSSSSSSSNGNSKQNASGSSSASRPTLPSPKIRQQPGASAEKAGKSQKLQDSQRQFRQANGSSMKADGDSKHASLALPSSKIPALYPSSGKGSLSSPNSNMSKPTNPSSASSSPSSSSSLPSTSPSKSSIPCLSLGRHIRTSAHTLPRPVPSSDSLQLNGGRGQNLALLQQQQQTQNGRPHTTPSHHPVTIPTSSSALNYSSSSSSSYSYSSSSSVSPTSTSSSSSPSSPSLLSPTAVGQGGRGGRAIHLHSIGSGRPQGGSGGPPAITPTSSTRDMA